MSHLSSILKVVTQQARQAAVQLQNLILQRQLIIESLQEYTRLIQQSEENLISEFVPLRRPFHITGKRSLDIHKLHSLRGEKDRYQQLLSDQRIQLVKVELEVDTLRLNAAQLHGRQLGIEKLVQHQRNAKRATEIQTEQQELDELTVQRCCDRDLLHGPDIRS